MECNKDEAFRSKGIAEAKFSQQDYIGAKKFAHKAKQLFPELEGIPQFISALEVHILAENKLQGGETNWYAILQVDPSADDNTIRKQYRKLALLLHPDKNKSVGAEAAFKHISEAWAILSDKAKKASYDLKCKGKIPSRVSVSSHHKDPPTATTTGCSQSVNMAKPPPPKRTAPSQPPRKSQTQRPPPPKPSIPKVTTFWTACPSCKMELEYQRVYLNKSLCCPVCYKPFSGKEVVPVGGTILWPPPHTGIGAHLDGVNLSMPHGNASSGNVHSGHVQNDIRPPVESRAKIPIQKDNVEIRAGVTIEIPSGFKEEIHQNHTEPRVSEERKPKEEVNAEKDACTKEAFRARFKKESPGGISERAKKKKKNPSDMNPAEEQKTKPNEAKEAAHAKEAFSRLMGKSKGDVEPKPSSGKLKKDVENSQEHLMMGNSGVAFKSNSTFLHKMPKTNNGNADLQGHINNKGKVECSSISHRKCAKSKRVAPTLDHANPEKKMKEEDTEGRADDEPLKKSDRKVDRSKASYSGDGHQGIPSFEPSMSAFVVDLSSMPMAAATDDGDGDDASITVPDGEFYDFDKDRSEGHFLAGQIWAAYDDDDGMPRYYAKVNKVFSCQPFKLQIAWLEPRLYDDETLAWIESGISITCGDFKLGKAHVSDQINTYSHMMVFERVQGQRGGFKIYPKKGDIWALYKEWDHLKVKEKKPGYIVVEILTDFSDKEGGKVWKLIKVDGFKTLFRRQPGKGHVELISAVESRRFSHRIPAYCLSADQGPRVPEGCWELDPAGTPPELITGK